MLTKKELEKALESLKKKQYILIGVLIIISLSVAGSNFYLDDYKNKDEEKIKETSSVPNKVNFNVSLDTLTKSSVSVFPNKKIKDSVDIINPYKEEKKERVTYKAISELESLGKETSNPYKNKDIWSSNIEQKDEVPTEPQNKLSRIEKKRKEREERRKKANSNIKKSLTEKIEIRAYVYRLQNVLPYNNVNLKLITPLTYKGVFYESGFPLVGTVEKVEKNRVYISVKSLGDQSVDFKAYDKKNKHEGIYFSEAGELERQVKEELRQDGYEEAINKSRITIGQGISAVINNDKRNKLTRIPLPNDFEITLKNY